MKIAINVGQFPKLSLTFILNQISWLNENSHQVEIVAKYDPKEDHVHDIFYENNMDEYTYYYFENFPYKYTATPPNDRTKIYEGINKILGVYSTSPNFLNKYLLDKIIAKPYKKIGPDIIHSHFGHNGRLLAKLKKQGSIDVPLVTSFHGIGIRKRNLRETDMYNDLFDYSSALLANSQHTRSALITLGANPDKVIIQPPGIKIDKFEFSPPDKHPKLDKIKILSVGRLVEEKGHKEGIEAINKLIETGPKIPIEYRIIGTGDQFDQLNSYINQLEHSHDIKLLGNKTRTDVINEMKDADILFHPSNREGLGVALLEAQAIGLPIVATKAGGIPDALSTEASNFLVDVGDIDEMVNQLSQLIQAPDQWRSISISGRSHVEDNYSLNKLMRNQVDLYKQIVG